MWVETQGLSANFAALEWLYDMSQAAAWGWGSDQMDTVNTQIADKHFELKQPCSSNILTLTEQKTLNFKLVKLNIIKITVLCNVM